MQVEECKSTKDLNDLGYELESVVYKFGDKYKMQSWDIGNNHLLLFKKDDNDNSIVLFEGKGDNIEFIKFVDKNKIIE
jgi:hypothetical protein